MSTPSAPVVLRLDGLLLLELAAHLGAAPLGLRGVALGAARRLEGLPAVLGRLLALTRQTLECWEHNLEVLGEEPPSNLLGVADPRVAALARLSLELNFDLGETDAARVAAAVVSDELDPWVSSSEGSEALTLTWCALTLAVGAQLGVGPSHILEHLWPHEFPRLLD